MNVISFRVLFVCIFLPPIMYVFSIQILEHYLQNTRTKDLQNVIIQDFDALYNGRHGIKEEIATNIEHYVKKDRLRPLGVSTKVVVTTKKKRLLYPAYFDEEDMDFERKGAFNDESIESFNYIKVAEQNFRILNDGIIVSVEVKVRHNSWLTNSILVIYLFASILSLYWYYKRRLRDWAHKREDEQKRIAVLSTKLAENEKSLTELSRKEQGYIAKIEDLNSDKEGLRSDIAELKDTVEIQKKKSLEIDEVLEEMERVEEEARMNVALKQEKEREIAHLREEMDGLRTVEKQGVKEEKGYRLHKETV